MATTTHTGPIAIDQINTTFYVVGTGTLSTIQSAVDYVRTTLGYGRIVVTQGINVADDISAVTGGNVGIVIWDNRNGNDQLWYWEGTNYQPLDFVQDKGFVTYGMPQQIPATMLMGFDPTGGNGNGAGYITVIANPGLGMPALNLQADPQDGTPVLTFFKGSLDPAGIPRVQSPATLELYSDPTYPDNFNLWIGQANDFTGSKGMYIWPKPLEDAIDFQGQTIGGAYDQAIRLNPLGGDVMLGPSLTVSTDGDITTLGNLAVGNLSVTGDAIVGGELQADSAVFDSCMVDESPVRTFANTPDSGPGEGMVWPDIGIPVSLGDAWQSPSIDPATIPYLNVPNTFTAGPQGMMESGAFMKVRGNVAIGAIDFTHPGLTTSWNLSQQSAETSFTNVASLSGAGAFGWYNTWVGGPPIDLLHPLMFLDSTGNLKLSQPQSAFTILGENVANASTAVARINLGVNGVSGTQQQGTYTFYTNNPTTNSLDQVLELAHYAPDTGFVILLTLDGRGTSTFISDISAQSLHATGASQQPATANSVWIDAAGGFGRFVTTGPSAGVLSGIQFIGIDSTGADYTQFGNFGTNGLSVTAGLATGGPITAGAGVTVTNAGPSVANSIALSNVGSIGYIDAHGANPSTLGELQFRVLSSDSSGAILSLRLDASGNAGFGGGINCNNVQAGGVGYYTGGARFWSDGGSSFLDGWPNGRMLINASPGANSLCQVTGAFEVTGTKSFVITHPLDETKELRHSCLEGPENGVYYRGEAVVVDGEAEVTLPDYFEALTLPTERSVQLTQIFEGSPVFAQIAASRVTDGKFKIHANQPDTKVWWEVKAVRGDVAKLEVTTKKETTVNAQPATAATGTQRTRTPEAGKPKPEKVRA